MILYRDGFLVDLFVDDSEPGCVHRAAKDLQGDLQKITGRMADYKRYLPAREHGCIVIGTLDNERFRAFLAGQGLDCGEMEGGWERYILRTFGEKDESLVICGSDERGTMWGIYHVCEHFLGVDPQYFWTDNEPRKREKLVIDPINYISQTPTFRFRGWFLNDEDLLTEWKNGGGTRNIDYPFYHQVIHHSILEKVVETALRLRQNLMIPSSFVDIMNPPEENLVRIVTERGMFVSQHHVEPMGVSHFGFENYWAKRGGKQAASYIKHPERFEEIWRAYAEKWAKYGNVIWQLGLRGRGDRPVWVHDPNVPESMDARGAIISRAIQKQWEIVADVLGSRDFFSTTTLWMEGGVLHNLGLLKFPKNTMIVLSDIGGSQMWSEDFYNVKRQPGRDYGLYYHVAFWGGGPRLAQITSPWKMYYNYTQAIWHGDTAYSVLNVGNIREFTEGIRANAEMTWSFASFDPDEFLYRYSRYEYGRSLPEIYREYFSAFHVIRSDRIRDDEVLMDGIARQYGQSIIRYLKDGEAIPEQVRQVCMAAFPVATQKWDAVIERIAGEMDRIGESRRPFYRDHMLLHAKTMKALYCWLENLWYAVRKDDRSYVAKSANALRQIVEDRKSSEHGKWKHWYRGDRKMNLPGLLEETESVL